tara:strand:+ start:197 stop:490 length:294 start_codon:yes stop_codon:yes gene_type:complete
MEIKPVIKLILNFISDTNSNNNVELDINEEMRILGDSGGLDSMKLVELCLILEEAAEEYEFDFDWTSEKAMSKTNSIFKSPKTLAEEFKNQYIEKSK